VTAAELGSTQAGYTEMKSTCQGGYGRILKYTCVMRW